MGDKGMIDLGGGERMRDDHPSMEVWEAEPLGVGVAVVSAEPVESWRRLVMPSLM